MADAEFEAKRLAELLEQANRQLAQFGEVTQQTQQQLADAQMKSKYGINNYTAVTNKAGEALGAVASAGIAAGKAMLEGKKGAAALNGSLDDLQKAATAAGVALTLLMPGGIIIKGVVAAFTAVTAATIGAVKAANEMSDKLYKGYAGLAKSGGAAADGMTGVFNNAKKLGLSMNELDGFVSLINENSTDLAQFSGSVAAGRKRLADMGDALRGSRQGFLAMGLSMQDVSEGMANYMRIQARTGNLQERSARDSAAAAKEYIYQQDALAKITGISVKEQQKQREAALTEQMFLAKVRQLEREGRHQEAKELQDLNILMNSMGEETGRAYRASVTGRLSDEAARKGLMSTNGEMQRATQMVASGQLTAAQAANRIGASMREVNARQGDQLALIGVSEQTHLKYAETVRGGAMAQQDYEKQLRNAEAERKKQVEGADAITGKQAELMNRQINTNEKMERALFQLIPAAQDVMLTMQDGADKLADAFKRIIEAIDELLAMFGFGKSKETKAAEQKQDAAKAAFNQQMEGATFMQRIGIGRTEQQQRAYDEFRAREADAAKARARDTLTRKAKRGDVAAQETLEGGLFPSAARGGLLTGPESGYLAMLHGTEMVVPIKDMGRKIEELGAAGLASGMDTMNAQVTAMGMGKDTAKKYNDIFKNMQASLQQPAEEGKEDAKKINDLVKEISVDLSRQAQTYDRDAKNVKKFSDFQETYQRKMTDYMKEVLDLVEDNSPEAVLGTAGATSGAAGTTGGGGGILGRMMQTFASMVGGSAGAAPPSGGAAPSGSMAPPPPPGGGAVPETSGGGSKSMLDMMEERGRRQLDQIFIFGKRGPDSSKERFLNLEDKLESRAIAAANMFYETTGKPIQLNSAVRSREEQERLFAETDPSTYDPRTGLAKHKVSGLPVLDPARGGSHQQGTAIDIQNTALKSFDPQAQKAFETFLRQPLGASDAVHWSLADGGVLTGPESGYKPNIEMHGTEAVIPLQNGSVPVTFNGSMSLGAEAMSLFQQMANQNAGMAQMLEELLRAQRNSVDVQQKMLRNATS